MPLATRGQRTRLLRTYLAQHPRSGAKLRLSVYESRVRVEGYGKWVTIA